MTTSSNSLGCSPAALELSHAIVKAAPTDASVLIIGESGTGKEVVARAVHERSARRDAPFVAVNCGAITPSLAESELFGHEKGSFTGASSTAMGCFERAHPGTLFLDEVTDMPLTMQVQLLRVLETGQYHRVGGSELRSVNLRIIAATNRDPKEVVLGGSFRVDLLYRLAVFPIRVPPLRERKPDIAYFAQRFLDELNQQEKTRKRFSPQALERLENYNWPGNVRELKNTVTRAFILADDVVDINPPNALFRGAGPEIKHGFLKIPVGTPLNTAQRAIIMATLDYYAGDKRRTALALGISPKTLYNRLERFRRASEPTEVV
ncbi:MAG TPA: sigma-54 dependent transcriptional regulator [Burkholderiaceae bacterium]|nr:sigma-54 dependent transcriptional regulator [Burkholderiaceae bacterium]